MRSKRPATSTGRRHALRSLASALARGLASALGRVAPAALVACLATLLLAGPAAALSINGPSQLVAPDGCFASGFQYTLTGAGPNAAFDYWVAGTGYNLWMETKGNVGTIKGNYRQADPVWTITARDDTGAVATKQVTYVPQKRYYGIPGLTVPGVYCHASTFRTYFAYDAGNPYTYSIQVSGPPGHEHEPQTVTFTEDRSIWVKKNYFGSPTIRTELSIPRNVYSNISYQAAVGFDASQPWSPDDPWRGVTASYESVFPYPTPTRVLADGGSTWNADFTKNAFGIWPRGIDYDTDPNDDFPFVQQLVDGYTRGNISPACQNTERGVFIGPYGYCVIPIDYDSYCFHYDPDTPVVTSSCIGTSSGDGLLDIPAPWPRFSLAAAWQPSPDNKNPASPWNGTVVTKVFAAPTPGQLAAIDALFKSQGIDLSTFPAVPSKALDPQVYNGNLIAGTGSTQVLWQLDGRRTFFCDSLAWQNSRLLAAAPYLVNGIYCDDETSGAYAAPVTAVGDPTDPTGGGYVPPVQPVPTPSCPVGAAPTF